MAIDDAFCQDAMRSIGQLTPPNLPILKTQSWVSPVGMRTATRSQAKIDPVWWEHVTGLEIYDRWYWRWFVWEAKDRAWWKWPVDGGVGN